MKTTVAAVDKAMAELSTTVQAQIDDVTASLEDKLTATVDADGATAIHTLKAGVRINGVMYNAGMSIAVLAQAGKPVVTRIGFNANQFVLMSGSGDTQYSPFSVINGQVFISDAFIHDGTITNAKIGNEIYSLNYVMGVSGWRIAKDGNAEFNNATFRGTVYATNGSFTGYVNATDGNFSGTVKARRFIGDIANMGVYGDVSVSGTNTGTLNMTYSDSTGEYFDKSVCISAVFSGQGTCSLTIDGNTRNYNLGSGSVMVTLQHAIRTNKPVVTAQMVVRGGAGAAGKIESPQMTVSRGSGAFS